MKKFLSIILAILMVVTTVPMVFAEEEITCLREHLEGQKCYACAENVDIIEIVEDNGKKAGFKHLGELNKYISDNAPLTAEITLKGMVYAYGYSFEGDEFSAYTNDYLSVYTDKEVNLTLDLNGYGIEDDDYDGIYYTDFVIWIRNNVTMKIINSKNYGGILGGEVRNSGKKLEIDAGKYNAYSTIRTSPDDYESITIINDGEFIGDWPVTVGSGKVIINGGTFKSYYSYPKYTSCFINVGTGSLLIKGGTFYTGVCGSTLQRDKTRIEGGTFYLDKAENKSLDYLTLAGGSFPNGLVARISPDELFEDGYALYDGEKLVKTFNTNSDTISGDNLSVKPHTTHVTEFEANCLHGDTCYCGKETSEANLDKHGNLTVHQVITMPTCSSYAKVYAYCDRCEKNEILMDDIESGYDKTNHSGLTYVDGKESTCSEKGWFGYEYCKDCSYTTFKELDYYDFHHDYDGDYKCDYGCGYEFEKPAPEEPTPDTPDEPTDDCDHLCHKDGFMGFIWKIVKVFLKLFKSNPVCECGAAHY